MTEDLYIKNGTSVDDGGYMIPFGDGPRPIFKHRVEMGNGEINISNRFLINFNVNNIILRKFSQQLKKKITCVNITYSGYLWQS